MTLKRLVVMAFIGILAALGAASAATANPLLECGNGAIIENNGECEGSGWTP